MINESHYGLTVYIKDIKLIWQYLKKCNLLCDADKDNKDAGCKIESHIG